MVLIPDRSPSPKHKRCQKIRPQLSGPSVTRASAHAQSMTKKQRNTCSVTPENVDKDMELADLEKIMDSFENEEEEKIIGTIVKIDNEGLPGISDSLPRITLKDSVSSVSSVNPPTVPSQGICKFSNHTEWSNNSSQP